MLIDEPKLNQIGSLLTNPNECLAKRFRALFTLRNVNNQKAIDFILRTIEEDSSALLKHECCFCLGQMQNDYAVDRLIDVLKNKDEHPMVRHEAGEALGAIGCEKAIPTLEEYSNDSCPEVAQTCQLAVNRIKSVKDIAVVDVKSSSDGCYKSVDPTTANDNMTVEKMREVLVSDSCDLYERYQAMFGLRNKRTDDAIKILGDALVALKTDKNNALLKHELAYVLGQAQNPVSVPPLKELLSYLEENEMVRHECAEALGSIATEEAFDILNNFKQDQCTVVRESIEVALDMLEYERGNDFQFLE